MRKSTLTLSVLAVILLGGWLLLRKAERDELSTPQHTDFFSVDTAAVDSIAFKYATWTYLGRGGGTWNVHYPDWSYPADPRMIRIMFEATTEMVLEDVITTRAAKHRKLKIDTTAGVVLQFFSQGQPVSRMVLGKKGPGARHTFVRRLDCDTVYQARGDLLQIFRRVPADWIWKNVFTFDTADVQQIRWREGSRETVASRGEDRIWRLSRDGGEEMILPDTALLNLKLAKLCPLRADAVQADPPPDSILTHGEPGSVMLTTFAGRADTLLWDSIAGDQAGRTYAHRPHRPKPIYVFFKPSYDRLFSRYDDLAKTGGAEPSS